MDKELRSLFPYGLNENARDKVNDCSIIHEAVGRSFLGFPVPRNGTRPTRSRKNRNKNNNVLSCEHFFRPWTIFLIMISFIHLIAFVFF